MRPNQRNEKIFSEGGRRKINPKVIVLIKNHIIKGKGVYKNRIVCVYKTLNSISKKGLNVLVYLGMQLRLNDAWVTQIFDLFPIREEIISRKMTICSLYGRRAVYTRRIVPKDRFFANLYLRGASVWYNLYLIGRPFIVPSPATIKEYSFPILLFIEKC